MKTCSYCGVEYPGDATTCAIDEAPLESSNPAPVRISPEPKISLESNPPLSQQPESADEPEDFRCLWRVSPFDADRLLKQFTEAGIRFQIDELDMPEPMRTECICYGAALIKQIDVYVHSGDKERAMEILAADWKV